MIPTNWNWYRKLNEYIYLVATQKIISSGKLTPMNYNDLIVQCVLHQHIYIALKVRDSLLHSIECFTGISTMILVETLYHKNWRNKMYHMSILTCWWLDTLLTCNKSNCITPIYQHGLTNSNMIDSLVKKSISHEPECIKPTYGLVDTFIRESLQSV